MRPDPLTEEQRTAAIASFALSAADGYGMVKRISCSPDDGTRYDLCIFPLPKLDVGRIFDEPMVCVALLGPVSRCGCIRTFHDEDPLAHPLDWNYVAEKLDLSRVMDSWTAKVVTIIVGRMIGRPPRVDDEFLASFVPRSER